MKTVAGYIALLSVLVVLAFAQIARAGYAVASWYGPGLYGNALGCGGRLTTGTVGVANRWMRCGARVTICFRGRCARTRVVDRGPYVAGRDFDLTAALAWRLRFGGVHAVYWRAGW